MSAWCCIYLYWNFNYIWTKERDLLISTNWYHNKDTRNTRKHKEQWTVFHIFSNTQHEGWSIFLYIFIYKSPSLSFMFPSIFYWIICKPPTLLFYARLLLLVLSLPTKHFIVLLCNRFIVIPPDNKKENIEIKKDEVQF